jgi:glycosyltransferase involved in cell wall biosynthesis
LVVAFHLGSAPLNGKIINHLKVLLTSHVFPPEFSGGTGILVHDVALSLMKRGHEVLVVTGHPGTADMEVGDCFDEHEIDSIHVVRYRRGRILPGQETNPMRLHYVNRSFEAGFRRLIAQFGPDVVHFHHLERLSVTAVDACREQRTPAFFTAVDYWCICPTHNLLLSDGRICNGPVHDAANCLKHLAAATPRASWATNALSHVPTRIVGVGMSTLKRTAAKFSGGVGYAQALAQRGEAIASRLPLLERIFVPTRFAQTVLERNGIHGVRFRVLPFGLRSGGYNRRIRRRGGGPLVLGFIGSLQAHKGIHVLLEAMRRLPETSPVELRIYGIAPTGGEPYMLQLQKIAYGDSHITFRGMFENRQVAEVLDGLDALVVPSLWHENMPLVSLSAQAAACPLIASDIGGLSDVVVHEENGLLFEPGSSMALAELIMRVLGEEGLLSRLSSQAVHPLDMERYVDELESEYRHACRSLN